MKKCFTINEFRSEKEILSYYYLIEKDFYQAIEIFYPYKTNDAQRIIYEKAIANLVNRFPKIEVVCHLPFGANESLALSDFREKTFILLKEALLFASKFRVKKTVLHLGKVLNNEMRITKELIYALKELCDYASQFEIKIAIENMPSSNELGYSPWEIKEILSLVEKNNLGFIYDTGHGNVSKYSVSDYFSLLSSRLWHIHINDNNQKNDEHKRIGLGNIDFLHFFEETYKINYQGLYCSEILYQTANDLELYYYDLKSFEKI